MQRPGVIRVLLGNDTTDLAPSQRREHVDEQAETAPVAWTPPTDMATAAGTSEGAVRLASPSDVLVGSILLGFPLGLGVLARNWYRLGRRRLAWVHLLAGAVVFAALALVPSVPFGLPLVVSIAISIYLWRRATNDIGAVRGTGRSVTSAPTRSVFVAGGLGWLVVAGPTLLLLVGLTFLGGQIAGVLSGTIEFGTGGSGCQVTGVASSFAADQPITLAAHLSRELKAGEAVHIALSQASGTVVSEADRKFDQAGICLSGSLPGGALSPGSYVLDYRVGSEVLASGRFTVRTP